MADEEIAIGTEQGFPFWHALGTLHRGAGLLLQGTRAGSANRCSSRDSSRFELQAPQVRIPAYLGMLAEAYLQAARFEDAAKR